jgi:hypothetical protein
MENRRITRFLENRRAGVQQGDKPGDDALQLTHNGGGGARIEADGWAYPAFSRCATGTRDDRGAFLIAPEQGDRSRADALTRALPAHPPHAAATTTAHNED